MHLNLQSTAFEPNFLIDSFRKILIRFWEFFSFCTKRYGCFSIGNVILFYLRKFDCFYNKERTKLQKTTSNLFLDKS